MAVIEKVRVEIEISDCELLGRMNDGILSPEIEETKCIGITFKSEGIAVVHMAFGTL